MNGRELYEAIYSGERTDRLPIRPLGLWQETLERWRTEGLGEEADPNTALGLTSDDTLALPLDLNMLPQFPIRVLEQDAKYVTLVDEFGVTKKMLRKDYERSEGHKARAGLMSAMSHWLDFPVTDLRTWKQIYEERFQPRVPQRLPGNWADDQPTFVSLSETRWVTFFCFPLVGLFGPLRELMGLPRLLYTMFDDPGLLHTMIADLTDFWLAVFAVVLAEVRLDQVTFFEDMCATKAPLISPAAFHEFQAPGYRKIIRGLRDLGVRHFFVDSDGNANLLIPEFLACGLTGIHPCEVQADMDVARLRAVYPQLNLNCGIDKRALAQGPKEIEDELRRCMAVAWHQGRYTPALDHGAPPDISWANAQHYARLYRQWCRESTLSRAPGLSG